VRGGGVTELERILSTREGRTELEQYFAGLIRAEAFDTLEAELQEQLEANPSPFAAACRASTRSGVAMLGWDQLHANIATLDRKGTPCTAIGIDLTGHGEGIEPSFEVSLYTDSAFPFSTADRDTLLAASMNYGVPWQGCFDEIEANLECRGLGKLHVAICGYPHRFDGIGATLPPDFAGFTLALWWLYLRVHQGIADALAEHGVPRAMPVLVGEHDFGPWLVSVVMAREVSDTSARIAHILADRAERSRHFYDLTTERMIAEIREKRAVVRNWSFWRNREQRRTAIGLLEASDKLIFADVVSTRGQQSVWLLSDPEFETLLDRFREHRRPGSSAEPHPDPGDDRSQLHLTFLQHGLQFGGRGVQREFLASRRAA
jgi:hypothetical protein